jgi:ribosomal protein L28
VNLEVELDLLQGWRGCFHQPATSNRYHFHIISIVVSFEMPSIAPRPSLLSLRKTLPPILNLPSTSTGNNVPKSLHKTRRTWITNTHRIDQPVRVLECAHRDKYGRGVLKGIKMRARDVKSFDKAGGVEGALVGLAVWLTSDRNRIY